MYLMVGTRPDLAAAVGKLRQFAAVPFPTHLQALERAFRYQATLLYGIFFSGSGDSDLVGYSGFDCAGGIESRTASATTCLCSTAAVSVGVARNSTLWLSRRRKPSTWHCHKQPKKTCGTRPLCASFREEEIGSIKVFKDSQGAIALVKIPEVPLKNHIDIHYHFLHKKVEDGQIELAY